MKRQRRRGERGVAMAMIGIAILVFFAMMAIAVDFARYAHTAAEVQAAADLAALSGARNIGTYGAGTAQAGADSASQQNWYNGKAFVPSNIPVVEGHYDPPPAGCSTDCRGTFTGGGTPLNAVKATATGPAVGAITSMMVLDHATQHDVTRVAIAAVSSPTTQRPTAPVVICPASQGGIDPLSPSDPCTQGEVIKTGIDMLQNPPANDNTCWSSLGGASANSSYEQSLLPPECGGITDSGRPVVSVGQAIPTQNGQADSVLQAFKDCVGPPKAGNANNQHTFILPVVDCGQCNQDRTVLGFVTLYIADPSQVHTSGSPKGIYNVSQICNHLAVGGGAGGGTNPYGFTQVGLVW